jgi:hypothetical protein
MPIYTLTLEERASCPLTCKHWRSCYGNGMMVASRVQAGPELEARLEREIEVLDVRHVKGFVVRLHVLGDFYSVEYVELWRRLLRQYSTMRIWGYTARIDAKNDPIAAALARFDSLMHHPKRARLLPSSTPTKNRTMQFYVPSKWERRRLARLAHCVGKANAASPSYNTRWPQCGQLSFLCLACRQGLRRCRTLCGVK